MPFRILPKLSGVPAIHGAQWSPAAEVPRKAALHSEIFVSSREASGAGLALALALDSARMVAPGEVPERRAMLWVQTREAARLTGRPYYPGLPPDLRHRVIHVLAAKAEDALFAMEEGVRCREIAFVLGEIGGNPRALDFTASRRLTLAAERHDVALYLVRHDAARDLSSARMRWEVRAAPSSTPAWNAQAPGVPAWHAELFRARAHAPGAWILRGGGLRGENGGLVSEPTGSQDGELAPISTAVG